MALGRLEPIEVGARISTELARNLIDIASSLCGRKSRDGHLGANSAKLSLPHPKGAQDEGELIGGKTPVNDVSRRDLSSCSVFHAGE